MPAGSRLEDGALGEIRIDVAVENVADRALFEQGYGEESDIRRVNLEGVVDTGAIMSMLPSGVVERLGLAVRRTVRARDGEERPVAGPLTIRIGDRFMNTDCIVGPPSSDPSIGRTGLATLGLIADRANRALAPRPESPDCPLLNLK